MKKALPIVLGAALLAGGFALTQNGPAEANKPAPNYSTLGKAPDFSLKRARDGKEVKLSDYKGKVRIVDFWATWCPPCKAEIPDFISLQKQYQKQGLEVIGVSVDRGGPDVVNQFAKEHGINYTSLMASEEAVAAYGGIRGIPTTFVIDRQGNIVKKYVGQVSKDQFEKEIKALL